MTVLRHQLLDDAGQPIGGRVATVSLYDPQASRNYQRIRWVVAISGDDGWLAWSLPVEQRSADDSAVFAVTGIEEQQVLIRVPLSAEVVLVSTTRIGTVPIAEDTASLSPMLDLVTEREFSERLSDILRGLTAATQTLPDASTTVKGAIRIGGDLGGTADDPTVPGLADKVSRAQLTGGLGNKVSLDDPRLTDPRNPLPHQHSITQLTDATQLGLTLLTAPDQATAQAAIGVSGGAAGTGSGGGGGGGTPAASGPSIVYGTNLDVSSQPTGTIAVELPLGLLT